MCPPTDFLNYGETGHVELGTKVLANFRAPFEFSEMDRKQGFAVSSPSSIMRCLAQVMGNS